MWCRLVKPRPAYEFILFGEENAILKGGTKSEKRKLPIDFLLLHKGELKESYAKALSYTRLLITGHVR